MEVTPASLSYRLKRKKNKTRGSKRKKEKKIEEGKKYVESMREGDNTRKITT